MDIGTQATALGPVFAPFGVDNPMQNPEQMVLALVVTLIAHRLKAMRILGYCDQGSYIISMLFFGIAFITALISFSFFNFLWRSYVYP